MIICEKHSKMIKEVVNESNLSNLESIDSTNFLENEFLGIDPENEIKIRIISISIDTFLRIKIQVSETLCPLCMAPNDKQAKNVCEIVASSIRYEYEISKLLLKLNESRLENI